MHNTDQLNTALAGRYRIEKEVGEGGMATVYLARDIRHDRHVALKVLKPELGAVLGVERFLSEIKVTANLQHPNLLPLFDSGESGGLLFYVMPFIEGESLRAKLEREKQLPIDEAVRLTVAIASALDYAHRHGVIHRDLKPENILLHDGQPVIADFGIALAVSKAGGARVTQTGLSLGTPQYMSPEQAAGDRTIDARSDIYSLAAMCYELIAGEPPHTGSTAQAIMAKLMTAEPAPLSQLRKSAPVHVEAAVERALSKLPADRFSTAKEFAEAIEGRGFTLSQSGGRTSTHRAAARPITRDPRVLAVAAVALVAGAAAVYQRQRAVRAEAAVPVVRFQIDIPATTLSNNSSTSNNLAVSVDGRTVAYVAVDDKGISRIYLRTLEEIAGRPLAGTEGATQPFFSPDGAQVGYVINNVAFKIPVGGGTPTELGSTVAFPVGLSWSRSGVIVTGTALGIVTIPANGGNGRVLVKPDSAKNEFYFNQPVVLDDGETVLFSVQPTGGVARSRLAALSLKTGVVKRFENLVFAPLGVIDGMLVYVSASGSLATMPFDVGKLEVMGQPSTLGVTAMIRASGAADAALSPTGTLVVQSGTADAQVGWVDQHGGFTAIGAETKPYSYPRLSPDGKRIAVTIGGGNRADIWLHEIASGVPTRLTSGGVVNERPEWSPDGTRVLYRTDRGKRTSLWWQAADLSGTATPLLSNDGHDYYEAVISSDGKSLIYQVDDALASQADVVWRSMSGDTTEKVIAKTDFIEAQARLSPDGKWVAFVTDASGVAQVVVQPFPGPGARVQVSVNGGTEPVWSRDGKKLFYRDGRKLFEASVSTASGFQVGSRTALFDDVYVFAPSPHANFDVAADGRFLMVRNAQTPRLTIVYGWGAELRRRAGTK